MRKIRRIAPKLYTTNLKDPPESVIRRHLYHILARYYPGAVVSHRSELEGGVARDDTIFLTYKYTKRVTLPGITIRLLKGEVSIEGDSPFMDGPVSRLAAARAARKLAAGTRAQRRAQELVAGGDQGIPG